MNRSNKCKSASLYQLLSHSNIPTLNIDSDLLFPKTTKSSILLKQFPSLIPHTSEFKHPQTDQVWFLTPFAFDPWWNQHGVSFFHIDPLPQLNLLNRIQKPSPNHNTQLPIHS